MAINNTLFLRYRGKENIWLLFIIMNILVVLLSFATQYILVSDELYFNALSERMTFEQIKTLVDQNRQWAWLTYVILPVFSLLKFALVASCLSLGYYFAANTWTFKPFLRVAIQAELILLLPSVIKLFWFLLIQTNYSLNDLQYFYPISLLNLFEYKTVSPYLLYFLQVVNLFELAYWVALAYGVSQIIKSAMPRAFGLVAASYGSGLLVWVVFIMFLTVSLS